MKQIIFELLNFLIGYGVSIIICTLNVGIYSLFQNKYKDYETEAVGQLKGNHL